MICGNLNSLQSSGLPRVLVELLADPDLSLTSLSAKSEGKYQPDNADWFYNIAISQTSPKESRHTELHELYADIQIVLEGEEV
ncbi:YhcH/YjgK/YiaL family protein, partial [Staphylococcus aureus]|uniref:YhcH/YjgK/YiaL family protein n=1 Tax=Staphylococcus aureus TaxID=1280 RepID=UPI00301BD1DA